MGTSNTEREIQPSTDEESNYQSQLKSPTQSDLNSLIRALSQPERRQALRYLDRQNDSVVVEELANVLASQKPIQEMAITREQLTVALAHKHLPLLVDIGLAEHLPQDRFAATDATADAIDVLDMLCSYSR